MHASRFLAVAAGVAVIASALVATNAASADVRTFTNQDVSASTTDLDISTVSLERTPKTLAMSITVDNVQADPKRIYFYLLAADVPADGADYFRQYRVSPPDEAGQPWGVDAYTRKTGTTINDTTAATYSASGSTGTVTYTVSVPDPSEIPWDGPTWVYASYYPPTGFAQASVVKADGKRYGFGPVSDLSIPTTVGLSLSTAKQTFGKTSATLSGTISPAASGTVELFDGATSLGTTPIVESATSFAVPLPNSLALGAHNLHAVFTPTTSRFAIGTSSTIVLNVVAPLKPTKVTLKLSHKTQHYKHKPVKATITVSGKHAGAVRIYDGPHKLKTLTLKKGKATYTFSSKLSRKKHTIKVVFLPKASATYASSTSKKVTLRVLR